MQLIHFPFFFQSKTDQENFWEQFSQKGENVIKKDDNLKAKLIAVDNNPTKNKITKQKPDQNGDEYFCKLINANSSYFMYKFHTA